MVRFWKNSKSAVICAVVAAGLFVFPPSAQAAGVNDFVITDYSIDYTLSRDSDHDNRSTLKTVETITANFPAIDQNHGIERAIPKSYDGHPVGLEIKSVTDRSGVPLTYSTYDSNNNEVVRIGDKNVYVHGPKTYVITYMQYDVTKFFKDTNDDEFYWDTNGTQWGVPISNLSVTLHVDTEVAGHLTDKVACYQGRAGSSNQCNVQRNGNVYQTQATNLMGGENVTIAVGFQPHTFGVYKRSPIEQLIAVGIVVWLVLLIVGIAITIWLIWRWVSLSNRKSEIGTIVPEYTPPRDASVTTSASILSGSTKTFAAQLVDFAVRHYIKIYEIDKKWLFGSKDYEIEIIRDIVDLHQEEQEILRDIFSGNAAIGARLTMSSLKNNNSVYMSTLDNDKKLKELIRGPYDLRAKDEAKMKWFKRTGVILLILAIISLNPGLLVAAIVSIASGFTLYPLTDKGLALSRYLQGLKMYIKVAEADRLKMLQSPEGAEKVGAVDPGNPKQMVKLYERMLPYAILFGEEKEWNNQLGKYYESMGGQPEWYSSNAVFSAAAFSSAMSGFSTTSSYTAASSSSSGGSSGGGSSGGGGGGGGGGGW